MIRRAGIFGAVLWLGTTGAALANHFGPLRQIKVGAKLALYQPEILLLLAVSGLVLSYWSWRDAAVGVAAFFAGVLLGFPLVFVWQIDMVWLALILIAYFGAAVAVQIFLPKRILQAYLVLAGACSAPLAFLGHHYSETTPLLLGNFIFTQFLVLSAAFLIMAMVRKFSKDHWWLAVVPRVFGSWAVAAAVMVFAFYLSGPVA
jgi:hypothetical protein